MEVVLTVLVFVGYVLALGICLIAVMSGTVLAMTARKSRHRTQDEAALEHPESGLKLHVRTTGGIILAVAGVAGSCVIVYHYWQTLLGVLLLLSAAGGEAQRRKAKNKPVKKVGAKKVGKRKYR